MWNPFKRKKTLTGAEVVNALQEAGVFNTTGAVSWQSIFGNASYGGEFGVNRGEPDLRLPAVMTAVRLWSTLVPSLTRKAYNIDPASQKPVRELSPLGVAVNPAVKIWMRQGSPGYPSRQLVNDITFYVKTEGNYYAFRERDTLGRTTALYSIHPSRIPAGNIKRAKGKEQLATGRMAVEGELLYQVDTGLDVSETRPESMLVPQDMIFHIKSSIPDHEHNRGMGTVENASRNEGMYRDVEDAGHKFYKKTINTGTFLSTDNAIAGPEKKKLEELFDSLGDGADFSEVFKTRILDKGLKPVFLGMPMEQMKFLETRAYAVEDVARWYDVPPSLLYAYMQSEVPNDLEQVQSIWQQYSVGPFLTSIGDQVRDQLIEGPSAATYKLDFNRLELLKSVPDKLSVTCRNMFEIGVLDRSDIATVFGVFRSPADDINTAQHTPVNIMLASQAQSLADKAEQSLKMGDVEIEAAEKALEAPEPVPESPQGDSRDTPADPEEQDNSPSDDNLDNNRKATNAAWTRTMNQLFTLQQKSLGQRKEKNPESWQEPAVNWLNGKFTDIVEEVMSDWQDIINMEVFIPQWVNHTVTNIDNPEVLEGQHKQRIKEFCDAGI